MDQQQSLFGEEIAPWQDNATQEDWVASVVLCRGTDRVLDYRVPPDFAAEALPQNRLEPGRRVRVPLGKSNRSVYGYCIALEQKRLPARPLKFLEQVVDSRALLSPAMLRLTQRIAEHYGCLWGQMLDTVVPAAVRSQAGTREVLFFSLPEGFDPAALEMSPLKQRAVMEALHNSGRPLTKPDLETQAGCSDGPIQALRKKGLIVAKKERVLTSDLEAAPVGHGTPHDLNPDQQQALDAILAAARSKEHQTLLLHGVTGSGKTEVYIRAIEEVISYGLQAIVLVPEISLTPQTVGRFRERFETVAVLHSHQCDAERHQHWLRIAAGEVQVVVGARSAVFAPVPHLGLIVLDEEHEFSFKQGSTPRYHARDVARWRAEAEKIPLLLGSATPSLESWHRAESGEDRLLSLPKRVADRPLPGVVAHDLRLAKMRGGAIGRMLAQAMQAALRDGGQVVLLLNRRGFSTHVQCPACGYAARCPNCELALTFHRTDEKVRCHYCEYEEVAPTACPDCRFRGIRFGGLGTQRLEAEVRSRFPNVTAVRMDTDNMQRVGAHEEALDAFKSGKARILLGTQMIAKGLDFPSVTLVGVIQADTALHLPDFRASERTFQLITQVAGRTGRGSAGGRVIVQTFSPDHPAIRCALKHDYVGFAKQELAMRQALQYPPFTAAARLIARAPVEKHAQEFVEEVGRRLNSEISPPTVEAEYKPRVLGPAPAPIPKLRGEFRYHLILITPPGHPTAPRLREIAEAVPANDDLQWIIDVDPVDML